MYNYCLLKNRKLARICLKNKSSLKYYLKMERATENWSFQQIQFILDFMSTQFFSVLTFGAENKWSTIKNKFQILLLITCLSKPPLQERGLECWKSERQKIRTLKVFVRMIRMLKDKNVKNLKRIRTSKVKLDFRRSDFTYGVRKNQNVENRKEQLPMAYCLCVPRPVGG
jgi:hypothetical protein